MGAGGADDVTATAEAPPTPDILRKARTILKNKNQVKERASTSILSLMRGVLAEHSGASETF